MNTISINRLKFVSAIASMRMAIHLLDDEKKNYETAGEKSEAFDMYVEGFMQLQNIIRDYKELVKKDIESINSIGKEVMKMDDFLIDLWK